MYVTVVTPDLLSVLDELDNSKEILSLLLSSSGTGHLQVNSKIEMSPPTTQPNLFEWNNIGGLVWGCVSSDTHPHTKPGGWGGKRSQCPRVKSSQDPKVQGFQAPRVPRYLKVLFNTSLSSEIF